MQPADMLPALSRLAFDAGRAILDVYQGDFNVEKKNDNSPLTRADLASHRIISAGLNALTPDLPVISEEGGLPDFAEREKWPRYWLVDPLDGTREFIKRNDEFTVNIALIDHHRPIVGVVYVPVPDLSYTAIDGSGAWRKQGSNAATPLRVSERCARPPRLVGSRSHRGTSLDALLESIGEIEMQPLGSSLKFCRIAEGAADFYPRFGPTSEWDTAAAQAVVEQAGGAVLTLDGKPLTYNSKADILNPHFLVIGARDRDWLTLAADAQPTSA